MCAAFAPRVSYAAEDITFSAPDRGDALVIASSIAPEEETQAARIDLNGDDIDEYIIQIPQKKLSTFNIIAYVDDKVLKLGRIKAYRIMVSNDRENGVRDILAFSEDRNDFEYETYQWDATLSRYIKKDGGATL